MRLWETFIIHVRTHGVPMVLPRWYQLSSLTLLSNICFNGIRMWIRPMTGVYWFSSIINPNWNHVNGAGVRCRNRRRGDVSSGIKNGWSACVSSMWYPRWTSCSPQWFSVRAFAQLHARVFISCLDWWCCTSDASLNLIMKTTSRPRSTRLGLFAWRAHLLH